MSIAEALGSETDINGFVQLNRRCFRLLNPYCTLGIQQVALQLWKYRTLRLVRAYPSKGTFQTTEVENIAALIKRWEEGNQTELRELAILINKIISVVKGCGGNAIVKYDVKEDRLVVWKFDGRKILPKDLYFK